MTAKWKLFINVNCALHVKEKKNKTNWWVCPFPACFLLRGSWRGEGVFPSPNSAQIPVPSPIFTTNPIPSSTKLFYIELVEPRNYRKAPFVLRTQDQLEMFKKHDCKSLSVRVIRPEWWPLTYSLTYLVFILTPPTWNPQILASY